MPQSINTAAFIFGIVFILAALIGKEIEIAAIKLPSLDRFPRLVVGIAGATLIYIGFYYPFDTQFGAPNNGPVIAYTDSNFAGAKQAFRVGTYAADQAQLSNDTISSLHVKAGYQVRACEYEYGQGVCQTFQQDSAYVGNDLNDKISYLEVTEIH